MVRSTSHRFYNHMKFDKDPVVRTDRRHSSARKGLIQNRSPFSFINTLCYTLYFVNVPLLSLFVASKKKLVSEAI